MIKAIIFDLDGTLLDTLTTITYYVNLVLGRENLPPVTEEECKYFAGNGARLLIKRALSSKGIDDEDTFLRVFNEYNREYNSNTLYLTKPYDQIPELILELRKRNIALAVLSNKPDYATKDIIPRFFGESFARVYGGRDGIPLKPMPDGVLMLYNELSVKPCEVLYVGDTGVDMETGRAAGARLTVGVSWGFRPREELISSGADVIVDSPLEILGLFEK